MGKTNEQIDSSFSIINAGTSIDGNIETTSDIKIEGKLKGNLKTQGKLILSGGGKIFGEIHAKSADIAGSVEGKIIIDEVLSLKASARMESEITTNKLAVEPGAVFTGTCTMGKQSNNVINKKR